MHNGVVGQACKGRLQFRDSITRMPLPRENFTLQQKRVAVPRILFEELRV